MFSENGVVDYLCKYEEAALKNEFDKQLDNQNRKQRRVPDQNAQKNLRKVIHDNNKKYEEAHDVIRAIRAVVPYSRMLISSDGYLVPLNDSYFRTDPSSLGFKYGGEMTCVGLITNFIGENTEPVNIKDDIFSGIQFVVNEILRQILPTNKKMICVIHPIAVYYGK